MKGQQLVEFLESFAPCQTIGLTVTEPFQDAGMYAGDDLVLWRINEIRPDTGNDLYLIFVEGDDNVCFRQLKMEGGNLRLTPLLLETEQVVPAAKVKIFGWVVNQQRQI